MGWPGLVELDVPYQQLDGSTKEVKVAFLWPHEVLESLYEAFLGLTIKTDAIVSQLHSRKPFFSFSLPHSKF